MSKSSDKKIKKRENRIKRKISRDLEAQHETRLQIRLRNANHLTRDLVDEILRLPWPRQQQFISAAIVRDVLRKDVLPDPFPIDVASLALKRRYTLTSTLNDELSLVICVLIHFKDHITQFIRGSQRFERAVLLGELATARRERDELLAAHGVSLWSIETGLLLGELEQGVKGNREALSEVQEAVKNPYIGFLSSFMTQRIEATVSVAGYDSSLRSMISEVEDSDEMVPMIAETVFRMSFHRFQHHAQLRFIMEFAREYSICDIYECFVRILVVISADPSNKKFSGIIESLLPKAVAEFGDPRLSSLSSLTQIENELTTDELSDSLLQICHEYAVGMYQQSLDRCLALLPSYPECFELYELAARAVANGSLIAASPFPKGALATTIFENVISLMSRNPNAPIAAANILKLGYVLDVVSIGHRIAGFWFAQSRVRHMMGTETFRALTSTRITPWCQYAPTLSEKLHVQKKLNAKYPMNAAVALHRFGPHDHIGLPAERRLKYEAHDAENAKDFYTALSLFHAVRRLAHGRNNVVQSATAGIIRCNIANNKHVEAAEEIVDAFLLSGSIIWGEIEQQLFPVVSGLLGGGAPKQNLKDFGWPLFVQICFERHAIEHNPRMLFAAYDDELRRRTVTRPTQLCSDQPVPRLLGFLKLVCVPDVLRKSYRFKSVVEMESERVAILQYLLKHDSQSRKEYTDEIAALTKKAMLRDAVHHVESSLIYVNTEGIQRSLGTEHEETFQRFVRIVAIEDVKLRKHLKLDGLKVQMFITFEDLGYALFKEIFLRIRDAFVSSKADGLNTYLSMRIRHGTLSGKLRGQFDSLHLVARRTSANGEYAHNEYWLGHLEGIEPKVFTSIDEALRSFSKDVDAIIEEVNNSWIRVRADADQPGMFDYTYNDSELGIYYAQLAPEGGTDLTHREFVEECFKLLWERTEQLLSKIRARILGELRDRLAAALAATEDSVKAAWPAFAQSELGVNLVSARTTLQRDTQAVSQWFTIPTQRSMAPFGFQLLIDTAAEMVRRIHPDRKFQPSIQSAFEWEKMEWYGDLFTPFFNIYFILFDNMVAHGSRSDFRPRISITLSNGVVELVTDNYIDESKTPDNLRRTIDEINELKHRKTEELRLQTEGRSGFEKIHNIVRNDLRRNVYQITVSNPLKDVFRVFISFESTQIFTGGES